MHYQLQVLMEFNTMVLTYHKVLLTAIYLVIIVIIMRSLVTLICIHIGVLILILT